MPTSTNATKKYVDDTSVTLREYLEALIRNLEESMDDKFLSAEKALATADKVNEMRLASMNEFRAALTDQAGTFITKTDHESLITSYQKDVDRLNEDIESLKLSRAELSGKASQSQFNVAMAISLISLLVGVVSIVFRLMGK